VIWLKWLIIRGAVSHPDAGRYALGLRVTAFDSIVHLCLGGWEEPEALGSKIIVVNVDDWDGFVQKEAVGAFVKHAGGILAEDGLRLYGQERIIASLCHLPIIQMLLRSTLPCRRAIAPPARKDHALISKGSMPVRWMLRRIA
jgi:hypothetical protein